MLVLSRRHGESIVIGDNVTITVLSVQGGRVRIGIDAPRSVPVNRAEVPKKLAHEPAWEHGEIELEHLQLA